MEKQRIASNPTDVSRLLVEHRHALQAYLYGFLHDHHSVDDVFQELSIVAIQKAGEFETGTNFLAWAFSIARNKLREYLRSRRGIVIGDTVFDKMEEAFAHAADQDLERRKSALRRCLSLLEDRERRFLTRRYLQGLSPGAIAVETRQTRTAVNSLLQRLR
jgi:RNA polymerase sigma-70 factor (ECF subfamily)